MKKQHFSKFAAILSGLVLVGLGALSLNKRSALPRKAQSPGP